jgi:hypothetical protein
MKMTSAPSMETEAMILTNPAADAFPVASAGIKLLEVTFGQTQP